MLTAARLREDIRPAGLDWITALRAPQVKALVRDGALQLSSMRWTWPRSPILTSPVSGWSPARTRSWKLSGPANGNRCWPPPKLTWRRSPPLSRGTSRPLRGTDKIALRADRVLRRRKVAKHFRAEITDNSFSYARNQDSITAEAALDGIYVLRTSVGPSGLDSSEVVSSYKALAQVERAFRAFNTDLDIRPIRHHTEQRVRAHVFLRMISYYITWHMHGRLAPLLFTDDDKPAAEAARPAPSPRPPDPPRPGQSRSQHTPGGLPVHSLTTLLADLATICLNQIQPTDPALPAFRLVTTPTPLQRGPRPARRQPPPRDRVVEAPPHQKAR